MQLSEYQMLVDLIEMAPVVGVMGLVIFFLWKDNRNNTQYIHEMDRANLSTLQDLSNLLENLVVASDRNKSELESKISTEAQTTRKHVDTRTQLLEERIKRD